MKTHTVVVDDRLIAWVDEEPTLEAVRLAGLFAANRWGMNWTMSTMIYEPNDSNHSALLALRTHGYVNDSRAGAPERSEHGWELVWPMPHYFDIQQDTEERVSG